MNEHHSDNMFEEDLIPEGLEYQDAFWELALDKIERKEAAIRVRNWSLGGGLAACVAMLIYFGYLHTTPTDAIALNETQVIIPSRISHTSPNDENIIVDTPVSSETFVFNEVEEQLGSIDLALQNGLANNGSSSQSIDKENDGSVSTDESNTFSNPETINISSNGHFEQNIIGTPVNQFTEDSSDEIAATVNSSQKEDDKTPTETNSTKRTISTNNHSGSSETFMTMESGNQHSQSNQENFSLFSEEAKNLRLELSQLNLATINPVSPEYRYRGKTKNVEGVVIPVSQNKMAFPITPFSLSLKFGSIFNQDYGTLANNFDPQTFIALDGVYSLNRKHFVSASFGYFAIKDVQDIFYSVHNYSNTTAHSDTSAISTQKLQYLTVPVSFGTRINERHQISIGVGIDIPVGAEQTLSNSAYQEYSSNVSLQSNETTSPRIDDATRASNYLEGFRPIQYFTQAEYSYAISSGMRVGFTYKYGLSDITNDEGVHDFIIGDFDRNSFLSGFVKFNIVGK